MHAPHRRLSRPSRAGLCRIVPAVLALYFGGCSNDSPSSPPPALNTPPASTSNAEISNPYRAQMLQAGSFDDSLIAVSGTACDSVSTVTSVTIDGQAAPLTGTPPCFDFVTQVNSRWGLNILSGMVRNQAGATTSIAQSYLRSPAYFTATRRHTSSRGAAAVEHVPSGVYIQINQALVDDRDRNDVDDLATVIARYLPNIDYNSLALDPLVIVGDGNGDGQVDIHNCDCLFPIPDIIVHSTGYRVGVGTITGGQFSVDYVLLDEGGVDVAIQTQRISMPVSVSGYLDPGCVTACATRIVPNATVTGTVSADYIDVDARVQVSLGNDGRPKVGMNRVTVTFSNPHLDIDWGALEFLDAPLGLSDITTRIVQAFQATIENVIANQLSSRLPPLVNSFIESFELPATITLPPPANVVLNVASEFDMIDLRGPLRFGSAQLGMAVAVSAANPLVTSPLGSIRRGGSVPTFSTTSYALGVGLKDDFLNQFMWAAWVGGEFEIESLSGLGCSLPGGVDARLSLSLPPVIMPGTNGREIDIGFGDVYIETVRPVGDAVVAGLSSAGNVALYASMISGAAIDFDSDANHLVLTLKDDPQIAVKIVRAPKNADLDALTAQYRALTECVLSQLMVQIVQAIPIPAPPIGLLGLSGVPIDARWNLGDGAVARDGAYYGITGNVVVR